MIKIFFPNIIPDLKAFVSGRYSPGILTLMMLLIAITPVKSQTLPSGFNQVLVANNLESPAAFAFAPDGRIFVAEQTGALRVIKNGNLLATPFVTLNVNSAGERGLIGVAFHPNFATNNFVYVYYTVASGHHNRISRFTANGDVAVAGSEVLILNLDPLSTATNHNGGALLFGNDGKLYVAVGENGNGSNSQNLDTYLGKILRINADGSVPAGNPFATGTNQRKRVWAYGMRNPFTLALNRVSGRIFANDVGENSWEEINDITTGGLNFGWPAAEGYSSNPAFKDPVYAYGHGSGSGNGCSIGGGTFFNPVNTDWPSSYTGKYFYLDFCGNWIDKLTLNGATGTRSPFASSIAGNPVGMETGADGNIYFLSRANSAVYKITYTNPGVTTTLVPIADAYVRSGSFSTSNFGGATHLKVRNSADANSNFQTFLKFNISAFTNGVTSAKLRLYGSLNNTANSYVIIEVYNSTNNSWNENSITWNNKPSAQSTLIVKKTITGTTKKYYELDVTALIKSLRSAGINNVTLKIVGKNVTGSNVTFNSSEASGAVPQLVVVHPVPRMAENSIEAPVVNFTVFPDPANDHVTIKLENFQGESDLKITDMTGKLVYNESINETSSLDVNTGDLKAGLYIITITNREGMLSKRLMIQR